MTQSEARQNGNPGFPPQDLASSPVSWAESGSGGGRVLFTRILARRNFADFPFWVTCTPDDCARLVVRAETLAAARGLSSGTVLATLSPTQIGVLRERMLLPEHPVSNPATRNFKRIFIDNVSGDHALFGETEHWTHVRYVTESAGPDGMLPLEAMKTLAQSFDDDALTTGFDDTLFARSSPWGFLTSNPAHAGTGLQCEAGLHLPALTATGALPQVRQSLAAMGFELLPLSQREPGAGGSGFFRLAARGGPDQDGPSFCKRFADKTDRVLDAERTAWDRWLKREGSVLQDRMMRSARSLRDARRIDFPELLSLVSLARASVYAGLLPHSWLPRLETLRVRAAPSHLHRQASGIGSLSDAALDATEQESARRAALARELLSGLTEP